MDGEFNYSEDDVKEASRAFTGWTVTNSVPRYPYGKYDAKFMFDPRDHDNEDKTFLGETGNFNGEDIVEIIVKQPATARFVAATYTTSSLPTMYKYQPGRTLLHKT
ncbi:MAG: hypothetical protein CM1200mP27_10610 [Chloroflexota bacterium]|nr:MAG: hypothetical protein CM1200mP27_10610 [Chloroflexota bacterium]